LGCTEVGALSAQSPTDPAEARLPQRAQNVTRAKMTFCVFFMGNLLGRVSPFARFTSGDRIQGKGLCGPCDSSWSADTVKLRLLANREYGEEIVSHAEANVKYSSSLSILNLDLIKYGADLCSCREAVQRSWGGPSQPGEFPPPPSGPGKICLLERLPASLDFKHEALVDPRTARARLPVAQPSRRVREVLERGR